MLLALSSAPAEAGTTFTVNTTADAADINLTDSTCDSDAAAGGQCTLRAAIEEANDTSGDDTITFNIVDGTNPAKTISPSSALPTITDTLTIDGYTQQGARANTLAQGNDARLNVVLDGLNAGVDAAGLRIQASDSTIKGLIIRRFDGFGVVIEGSGATGNRVEGNFIGVNRDGITDRGNTVGVYISSASNTVGGTQPEMRNVISGNDQLGGIYISGTGASENGVEGNFIGTTADGTADLGNGEMGVAIQSADNNTIGGTASGTRNVISGNDEQGVYIQGTGTSENRVEGNFIGTTADGTAPLGNTEDGVHITGGPDLTAVGGTTAGAANRIANNGGDGVHISHSSSTGNHILSNRIYNNGGLGIDLTGGTEDASGVTSNDTADPDTGPDNLQNFPVITSATRSTATPRLTTISGRLNTNPIQDFVVQCFLTNSAPATAHGEGSRLLDTVIASSNANGNARFSCESSLPLLGQVPGQTVSATATNIISGDSSEFSRNRAITNGGP